MKLLIVVHHRFNLWRVPAWFVQKLAEDFPHVKVVNRESYDDVQDDLRDAEVIFTISLRREQFALCRRLRWIHAPTAAVHQFQFPELINSDVVLTNSTEVHGPVVAEHVIAQIFALAKKIPQIVLLQHKHVWGQETVWNQAPRPREVAGATLGLIGVGSIGRRVAQMASAIGMRVIAVREHVEKGTPDGVEKVLSPLQIDELLRQSDFVVIAAPLIPATEKLIDASRLSLMKPEAYLINVGRGPQVDEFALFEALRDRRIGGAALDVFEHEPLPTDSPLWDLDNLLITRTQQGSRRSFGTVITSTFPSISAAFLRRNHCNTLSISTKAIDRVGVLKF